MEVFFISVCGEHYEEVGARELLPTRDGRRETQEKGTHEKAARLSEGLFAAGLFQLTLQKMGTFRELASATAENGSPCPFLRGLCPCFATHGTATPTVTYTAKGIPH